MKPVVGCRVEKDIYYKIKNLDISQSDFLRSLIYNYFSDLDGGSKINVNSPIEDVNSLMKLD